MSNYHPIQYSGFKRHTGFTLLELLIALFLGLLLIAGVIQLYLSSKQAFRSQETNAQIQDDARFVIDTIIRQLHHSGLRNNPKESQGEAFPEVEADDLSFPSGWPSAWEIDFGRGQSIIGQDGNNTDGIPQDRLYFRSQAYGEDDTLTNCSGGNLGGGSTTIFYIDDATKSLQCVFNGSRISLVNNVVGMDISYKVDMVEFSPDNPQALMTATQIEEYNTAAAAASTAFLRPRNLWNRVIGVKIDFLLRSQNTNITTETQAVNFNGVTATPDENRLFRTFSTAVMLRNSPGVNSSELLDD